MARDPRTFYGESGLVEITSRTTQGRYLLPPTEEVNAIISGVLGRAQRLYQVWLHAFIFLSNHFHLLMSVLSAKQMADFTGYFKSNVARELGPLHDWEHTFWGGRYSHLELALTEEDQIKRVLYLLDNGCKEGLVGSPYDWGGVSSARALSEGRTELDAPWFDRTAQYRASLRGKNQLFPVKETVHLTPLPFLQNYTPEEQKQFYRDKIREIELKTAQMHRDNGTQPLGMDAILRRHPHFKPKKLKSSPTPRFLASNPEDYRALQRARAEKLAAYREAAARLKDGETDVTFPEGCFPPPRRFVESHAPT